VALSADGNTAIVGGPGDNGLTGAAWVYTRSGNVWTQQGNKLVGTGVVGPQTPNQAVSVALSVDGNTAIVGGNQDNNKPGRRGWRAPIAHRDTSILERQLNRNSKP
jgi:hypothetical protein